jgi:hypothetical protein
MLGARKPAPLKWLIRSLSLGAVFLVIWLVAMFGPAFSQVALVRGGAAACLALCLIVAAVAFVFEVVRRVTSA